MENWKYSGKYRNTFNKTKRGILRRHHFSSRVKKRLQLENRISEYLDVRKFIPAIGQVAIGVEYRKEDAKFMTY